MDSIHQFKVTGIDGKMLDFSDYAGKKMLIVNVASECGYTGQYAQLQELYETFGDKLVIVGFPCNDFDGQEPGSEAEIQAFCQVRYGVTFPLSKKISILGEEMHPVYQWLTQKTLNGVKDSDVRWNFQKYLIDEQGRYVTVVSHLREPADEKILNWLNSENTVTQ